MFVHPCPVLHVELSVAGNIAHQLDSHILRHGAVADHHQIFPGDMVGLADFQGVDAHGNIGKSVIDSIALDGGFVGRCAGIGSKELMISPWS